MKSSHLLAALLATVVFHSALAQGMRAEVGKPLQQASEMLKAGKAKEALAKVREADAAGGKTGAEQLMIDRMKAAAAQRAGDTGTAIAALESIYGRVGGGEQGQIAEQLASAHAQARNNAKATEWLNKAVAAGNNGAGVKQLQAYLQSNSGDYAAIARDAGAAVGNAESAGRRPEENDLLRLADAQQRTGNANGYLHSLEKLLAYYPKKDYWTAYLGRVQRKPGFGDRYALDVLRLKLATGGLTKTEDFMEMAQLALQGGFAAEGKRIVDKGFASGALGTGAEAERHKRLRDLAIKKDTDNKASLAQAAADAATQKTGDDLVKVGFAMASAGEAEKGAKLIEQGIALGKLTRPDEAKLRLGQALMMSGGKAKAVQTLRSVQGTDGASDIARMWVAFGNAAI
jgi:hypothetical protein